MESYSSKTLVLEPIHSKSLCAGRETRIGILRKTNLLDMTTRWHSDCSVRVSVEVGPREEREQGVLDCWVLKGNPREFSNLKYSVHS